MIQNAFYKTTWLCGENLLLCHQEIDSPNPHNLKGDAETWSESPSQQASRVSEVLCRNPAQWWGQAFNQVVEACDERARRGDKDGTGKLCAVGEAVARASVSAWCLSLAVGQPRLPREGWHQAGLLRGPGWWVGRGVPQRVLWSRVGLDGAGTTSSRCSWSLFQWAVLENSTKPRLSKAR